MEVVKNSNALQQILSKYQKEGKTVGFVPTMGALHVGHFSLLEIAKNQTDITVCSIFVNPTQFNNSSDLTNYPREVERDLKNLDNGNCDVVFLPQVEDIYPNGAISESYNFGRVSEIMEGEHRPGHFDGVATVINRFYEIVKPNRAFFGEKDYQQYVIVDMLAKQKHPNVKVIGCPIYREDDGLAMSSRNERLNNSQRTEAPIISKALFYTKEKIKTDTIESIQAYVKNLFTNSKELELEYFEIVDENFENISNVADVTHARAFIAAFAGEVRLIDNLPLF